MAGDARVAAMQKGRVEKARAKKAKKDALQARAAKMREIRLGNGGKASKPKTATTATPKN